MILLMILLRNVCGLVFFFIGWDNLLVVIDYSFEVDIVCIKYFRNVVYVYVERVLVDDVIFFIYWCDIWDILIRLGGSIYEVVVDSFKDECMDLEM